MAKASAVAGLLVPVHIPKTQASLSGSRTALLMPIYNEDPTATTSALQAMAEALAQAGAAQHFEIVIISDSTQVDPWINESLAVDRLRRELRNVMPVWYRRRWLPGQRHRGRVRCRCLPHRRGLRCRHQPLPLP